MQRICTLVSLAIVMAVTTQTPAGVIGAIARDIHRSYHRNRCWPNPFVYQDNMAVRAPFAIMVHNGWRLQNLISDQHFKPQTSVVNEAGHHHIRWVLTQAPLNRRTIYVEQGLTPRESELRLEATREVADRFALAGEPIDVRLTTVRHHSWSGAQADAVNIKFGESMPEPRLPEQSSGFETN